MVEEYTVYLGVTLPDIEQKLEQEPHGVHQILQGRSTRLLGVKCELRDNLLERILPH